MNEDSHELVSIIWYSMSSRVVSSSTSARLGTIDEVAVLFEEYTRAIHFEGPHVERVPPNHQECSIEQRYLADIGDLLTLLDLEAFNELHLLAIVDSPALCSYQQPGLLFDEFLGEQRATDRSAPERSAG